LHWTPRLDALVDQYVRRTIGAVDGEATPDVSRQFPFHSRIEFRVL
jgi:hypothetical protein